MRTRLNILADIRPKSEVAVLIQYGKRDPAVERPPYDVIVVSGNEVDKQREIFALRRSSAVQVNTKTSLVAVVTRVKSGTVENRIATSRLCFLKAPVEIGYLPDINAVTVSCVQILYLFLADNTDIKYLCT